MKRSSLAVLSAGALAVCLGACTQQDQDRITDLNNLQGEVIGKVNCTNQTFVLDADQAKDFADFAGQWMSAEAFSEKWVEKTGDTYGSQLAKQVAEAALGEACNAE